MPLDLPANPAADERPAPPATAPQVAASVASLEQAALWYATLRDEDACEQDRLAWRAWLQASPENTRAWEHIDAVSRRFEPLRGPQAGAVPATVAGVEAARRGRHRRRLLNGLASVLGLGVAGWLGWRHAPVAQIVAAVRADHRTGTGELRQIVLADGTRTWLNTATALQVDYQDTERRLVLWSGEILVDTAQDGRARPFYVQTRFGRLQALGTRFTVQLAEAQTRLDVFEGTVEIRTATGQLQRVAAGQAAAFDGEAVTPLGRADHVREAWHKARLPADDMPLGALLAELGRYRHGHISVAPEVAGLKVMGVYPTDDTERALAMLERHLPIRVHRTLPWWTTVEAR